MLTYAAGKIEPDPALRLGDAVTSLDTWGSGVELLTRLVPGAAVLPVAVSGVISQRMLSNPLARWRATYPDREWVAATLEMLVRDRSINPVLSAGEPLWGTPAPGELPSAMVGLLHDCVARGNGTPKRGTSLADTVHDPTEDEPRIVRSRHRCLSTRS